MIQNTQKTQPKGFRDQKRKAPDKKNLLKSKSFRLKINKLKKTPQRLTNEHQHTPVTENHIYI